MNKLFKFNKVVSYLPSLFSSRIANRGISLFYYKRFCDITRLNFDKLNLDKLDDEFILINKLSEEDTNKSFNKEESIIEYSAETNWEDVVLKSEIPVVVDCYAVWCGPCKKLMPMLDKKLEELKNFKLVKINIETHQELAGMLNITSVPTVFLVYKGNVVDSFVGLPTPSKLDNFFESVNLLRGLSQNDKVVRALLLGVDEFMSKRIYDRAENMLNEAYSHEKWRGQYAHIIKLGLAICAYNKPDYKMTEKFIEDLKSNHKAKIQSDPVLNKKLALLEIKLNLVNNPELINNQTENYFQEIEKNPNDLTLRYKLAVFQFETSEYEKSIDTLLEIIQIDRNWKDKLANQLLLQIFNFLGADSKLTLEGRKRLTKILY